MSSSAICNVNNISSIDGYVDVSANSTFEIELNSLTGANVWTIQCIYTDNLVNMGTINASAVINNVTKKATFMAPNAGSMIFQSVVNGGIDVNGRQIPDLTFNFKVCVPISGLRTLCVNETTEHDISFGWVPIVNEIIVAGGSGSAGGVAGGDLSGSYPNPSVQKINGATVPSAGALTTGNVPQVSGSSTLTYAPINLAGGSNYVTGSLPTGNQASQTMAGDVTGTTAASTVVKLRGKSLASALASLGAANDGYVLTWVNGSSDWEAKPAAGSGFVAGGDLSGTSASQTVNKINHTTITTAGGALTTGTILRVTGASVADWGALDLANANAVTGVLPAANLPSTSTSVKGIVQLAGDLGGTSTNVSVLKVNGIGVSGTPSTGQVLTATGSTAATWQSPASGTFTAGGDLGGTTTNQTVLSVTGSGGTVIIATTGAVFQWAIATSAPTIKQADITTASATGQVLKIQAQNATGTTATGGDLVLAAGSGTTLAGAVRIRNGASDEVVIATAGITVTPVHTDVVGNSKCVLRTDIGNIATTSTSQTTLYSWTLASNAMTSIDVVIVARGPTTSNGVFKRSAQFVNNAGTVTQINTTTDNGTNLTSGLTWLATIDFTGTTGRVRVTGGALTIQWGVVVQIVEVIA